MIRRISLVLFVLALQGCFYGGASTTQPSYSPPAEAQPTAPPPPPTNPDIEDAQQALYRAGQNSTVATQLPLDLERARAPLNEAEAIWKREKGEIKPGDEEWAHIEHLAYIARQRAAIAEAKARSINALRGQPSPPPASRSALAPPPVAYVSPPVPSPAPTPPATPPLTPPQQADKPAPLPARVPPPAVVETVDGLPTDWPVSLKRLDPRASTRGVVLTFGDEYFVTNGTLLKPSTGALMDSLVQYLSAHPGMPVVCEGYSDVSPFGGDPRVFAEGRARSVQEALYERGVEFTRVSLKGYGNLQGGGANRRVDVVIKRTPA